MDKTLKWQVNQKNGCVEMLKIDNNEIRIGGWGVEASDRYSFFSQDKLGGTQVKLLEKKIEITDSKIHSFFIVKLKKILLKITLEDEIENLQIIRKYVLESLNCGYLSDFVTRIILDKQFVKRVNIAGENFQFQGSNLYRQYLTNEVFLETALGNVKLFTKASQPLPGFELLSYVRDEPPNKWVIHHRLLASKEGVPLLQFYKCTLDSKWCPLLKLKSFKEKFWLYSEEKNSRLPFTFQVGSYSFLSKGDKLEMFSTIIFETKNKY